jgi:hypothetical protein
MHENLSFIQWLYSLLGLAGIASVIVLTLVLEESFGDLGMFAFAAYFVGFAGVSALGIVFASRRLLSGFIQLDDNPGGFLQGADNVSMVVVFFIVLLFAPIAFGQMCRELFIQFGGFTGVQGANSYSVIGMIFGDWTNFAYSWLLNSLTFNATQVFGWATTPIQASAWWSGWLIVLFSVVADFVLFAGLLNLVKTLYPRLFSRR